MKGVKGVMDRFQIENLYKVNGLTDYKLKSTEDLLKVHGIDIKSVKGYDGLNDEHRELYEKFIINFFNQCGLDSRATLRPRAIHYVEEIELLAKEDPKDDHYILAGGVVNIIDKSGQKRLLHEWEDEDYEHLEKTINKVPNYLRFEYADGRRKEWQHVMGEDSWY